MPQTGALEVFLCKQAQHEDYEQYKLKQLEDCARCGYERYRHGIKVDERLNNHCGSFMEYSEEFSKFYWGYNTDTGRIEE